MDAAVIIVGAGPAGLMLAGEPRIGGVEVVVLERLAEPTDESRCLGITVRTMEVFHQRGLLTRFGDLETGSQGYCHIPLDFGLLDGPHLPNNTVRQSRIEAVLEEWATGLGADIRRGHDVLSVAQRADEAGVVVRGPDGEHGLRSGPRSPAPAPC